MDRKFAARQVVDNEVLGLRAVRAVHRQCRHTLRRRLVHDLPVAVVKHHRQRVVREDFLRDLRNARKHAPDIEHVGNGAQQFDRRFDARRTFGLERGVTRRLGQPLMREREREIGRETLGLRQVVLRISV